jgi:hypothetical protein
MSPADEPGGYAHTKPHTQATLQTPDRPAYAGTGTDPRVKPEEDVRSSPQTKLKSQAPMAAPIDALAWDSSLMLIRCYLSMLQMVEAGMMLITMISFFISAYSRGSRGYLFTGIGSLLMFLAGRCCSPPAPGLPPFPRSSSSGRRNLAKLRPVPPRVPLAPAGCVRFGLHEPPGIHLASISLMMFLLSLFLFD